MFITVRTTPPTLQPLVAQGWRKGTFKGYLAVKIVNDRLTLELIGFKEYVRAKLDDAGRYLHNVFSKKKWASHGTYNTDSTAIKATAIYMYTRNQDWKEDRKDVNVLLKRVGLTESASKGEPTEVRYLLIS